MAKLLLSLNQEIGYNKKMLWLIFRLFGLNLYLFLVYIGFTFKITPIPHFSVTRNI